MTTPKLAGLSGMQTGNIYCIGRNYAAHARELDNPVPSCPVIFTKPTVSLTFENTVTIPSFVKEPHFEAELVVALGKKGKNIPPPDSTDMIAGYGIGIDITARDIQQELKEKSHPWFLAKGLDEFAPVSSFVPAARVDKHDQLTFTLDVNGRRRQNGDTSQMLFPVGEIIAYLSRHVTLLPGDLIFTGTPEGVGKLLHGDLLHADLESGLVTLDITINHPS